MILKLLGGASIETAAGPLAGPATQRRRLALLARLAMAGSQGLSRDKLIAYLWPESDTERARHLLSDSLYRINRALGGEVLVPWGDQVRLDPARLPTDAVTFEDALAAGDLAGAVAAYGGPFLDGFFLGEAVELERWIEAERERLARAYGEALEALATAATERGAHPEAVRHWQRLAAHDPLSSRVALGLVGALIAAGDRAAALQHARYHEHRLRSEWGAAPADEFADAVRSITRAAAPITGDRPSVAILPFAAIGGGAEDAVMAHGMTVEVIAQLAKVKGLRVVSLAAMGAMPADAPGLRETINRLKVATVLEGSVRSSDRRLRIVAQLGDRATGQQLWAESWDRDPSDIFAVQVEVALHIASALAAELTQDERSRIARLPTRDLQAYHHYLNGRHQAIGFDPPAVRRAIACFERAISCDPEFAPAHASLAMMLSELGEGSVLPAHEAYPRARAAAAEAIRLDPELAEGHAMAAYVKMAYEFDWEGAESGFRRALELSPGSADTCDFYGRLCAGLGRFDEAVDLLLRARELDPLTHRTDIATAYIRAGRFREAEESIRQVVEVEPHDARASATLGWALMMQGRTEEGVAALERAVALAPDYPQWRAQLGQACGMTGQVERAREILGQLVAGTNGRAASPYQLAYVHVGLGEHDEAMDCLEQAHRDRTGPLYSLKGSFLLAPLRTHPRFKALMERMGLGEVRGER